MAQPPPQPTNPLASALTDSPHTFLQPPLPLYTDTLAYLKHALDPLAQEISKQQQERQQEARKKRKRGHELAHADAGAGEEVLRIKQIWTEGFSVEQVWEQARRVVDAVSAEAERGIVGAEVGVGNDSEEDDGKSGEEDVDEEENESLGEEGVDYEVEGVDVDGEDLEDDNDDTFEDLDGEDGEGLDGMDMDMAIDEDNLDNLDDRENDEPTEEFVADKFGLNDGFFSIDDFNRRSDFLEQQDARGDGDGAASDEEEVDWDADPVAQAAIGGAAAGRTDGAADDDDHEEEEEGGATFGDPDAPSEDEDADEEMDGGEMDAMGGLSNTNNILYADFFAPPAQKQRKNKKGRPNPHNFPETPAKPNDAQEGEEDDVERTIAAVHRDLFEDNDESDNRSEEALADRRNDKDPSTSDPRAAKRSTHEKRRAALAEEIRKLEAAAVAKRAWTLSGEARASDRPINSLLEEDLDFERAGKPVPVITAEVSESLEELIKRRILAFDFQDLVRRRPEDVATGKDGRRGRLDYQVDDAKSKKGLAEEYEEEHLRLTDPNFVDAKDEKTKKEEQAISALWQKVSADLDSLSSWHFRPKKAAPVLEVRVDAPAIGMEDARPAAGGEVAGASRLAPQEVYRAGEGGKGEKGEVVGKSGLPAGREEMGREERKRVRRRNKERIRKAGGNAEGSNAVGGRVEGRGKKDRERKEMLGDLKRGGVGVIGKKGDVRDVEGRGVDVGRVGRVGGGMYKL